MNNITHTYAYDGLNRLTSATGTGTNAYTQTYAYDAIGNITYKSDVGTYAYTYTNKPHAVRTAGNITLQYDDNGNMTSKVVSGGTTLNLTWNEDNKPATITVNRTSVNFVYTTETVIA